MQKYTKICQDHHTCWLWPIMPSRGAAAGCDVNPPGWVNIYRCCCLKSATVAADKTGVINRGANYKDWAVEFWAEDPCRFIFLLCCACKLGPKGSESFLHSSLFILSGRYCRSGARGKDVKCRDRSGFAAIWENSPSVGCDGIRHGGETCATRNPGFYDGAWWRNTRSFLLLTIYSLS